MFGFFPMPWWGYVVVLMAYTQLTILAVTLYLHRCQAHRALSLHPLISHIFRLWLWLTTGMITKEWAAIHRKHHAKVETDEDPHSPQAKGLKLVFFQGAELYRQEAANKETSSHYGAGTPDDWLERHIYARYNSVGIGIMLVINMLCFGALGLTIWALQMAWIPFFAAGVINGIGHYWGYRNFECKDASRNIFPWGIFVGGEELHNNHHAFATSAKFSAKWWEIDSGWIVIRLLQAVGLAQPRRILPTPKICATKTQLDVDTLKALITYRFQVMASYTKLVVVPALHEEKKRACKTSRSLLAKAKILLVREASIMKASQQQKLAKILADFHSLQLVYQFRLQLQEIWSKSTASQKELVEALQEWCRQAEAAGSEGLAQFARQLKTYVPAS